MGIVRTFLPHERFEVVCIVDIPNNDHPHNILNTVLFCNKYVCEIYNVIRYITKCICVNKYFI